MEKEKLCWLAFSAFEGIGPKRFALLKTYFGTAQKAWEGGERELLAVGLGSRLVSRLIKFRKSFDPYSYFLRLREKKIDCYFIDDENYPENLKKIDDPPIVLYGKGEMKPVDKRALAVVGTRRMTDYGARVTESLVKGLVELDLTIVSGLARGIDTMAHRSALKADGRTIGVLACGLDDCYPPENKGLVEKIIKGHGAIVSERPLGVPLARGSFPARNRLISGLSLGTVVVEGAKRSGTLITARQAAEQGREVFAVPGSVTSPFSAGPAHLIQLGAKLVLETKDILEELGLASRGKFSIRKRLRTESIEEEVLSSLMRGKAKSLEQLVQESGFDIGQVASIMAMLEIKGKVKSLKGNHYQLRR